MHEPKLKSLGRARGIYLLPNLFTTGGMFAGFYAIIAAMNGDFEQAAIAVFVAALLDGLDGRIARITHTQSDFGVQYDSLADLISFGLAPALVMYTWALDGLKVHGSLAGKVGWSAAFLYAACAAVRLARFNAQVGTVDKRYFIGLASPAAAGLVMSFVWCMVDNQIAPGRIAPLALAVTVAAGLLMVSRFRYWSFKSMPSRQKMPFCGCRCCWGFSCPWRFTRPASYWQQRLRSPYPGRRWAFWLRCAVAASRKARRLDGARVPRADCTSGAGPDGAQGIG